MWEAVDWISLDQDGNHRQATEPSNSKKAKIFPEIWGPIFIDADVPYISQFAR